MFSPSQKQQGRTQRKPFHARALKHELYHVFHLRGSLQVSLFPRMFLKAIRYIMENGCFAISGINLHSSDSGVVVMQPLYLTRRDNEELEVPAILSEIFLHSPH